VAEITETLLLNQASKVVLGISPDMSDETGKSSDAASRPTVTVQRYPIGKLVL